MQLAKVFVYGLTLLIFVNIFVDIQHIFQMILISSMFLNVYPVAS